LFKALKIGKVVNFANEQEFPYCSTGEVNQFGEVVVGSTNGKWCSGVFHISTAPTTKNLPIGCISHGILN
jgi:hypothetical protein